MSDNGDKETWNVEREFIEKITSKLSDISDKVDVVAQETADQRADIDGLKQDRDSEHSERISPGAIFRCTEVSLSDEPISEMEKESKMRPFRQEVKELMKKYRVVQVGAMFLSKL